MFHFFNLKSKSILRFMPKNPTVENQLVKRVLFSICMILFVGVCCFAQDIAAGKGAFESAATAIKGYSSSVKNLMNAIAAVIAIVGAFNVYFKMQNGDQDVKKTIMLTIGGCVAFVAMGQALPMFFE